MGLEQDLKAASRQRKTVTEYSFSMIGGMLYAAGLNIFVIPLGLYIGTVTGIAQMLESIINTMGGLDLEITGPLLFIINIPLMLMTYQVINKSFFFKTLLTVAAQSLALAILPIPATPLIEDWLTLCIIGGLVSGFGAGLSLRHGGSGGGLDILGVWLSLKFRSFSVGKVSILISSIVMIYVAFNFPIEILIYSVVFTMIYSLVLDRVHYQNVKVFALIVTEKGEVAQFINQRTGRGITMWEARGIYSNTTKNVILAILDKYEFLNLKKELLEKDPELFMIDSERVDVTGTFDKHLFS